VSLFCVVTEGRDMPLVQCRVCGGVMSDEAPVCPHCGHPTGKPYNHQRGFEWRTRAEIMGWPLIHIATGRDPKTGKRRVAKGIIAIGRFGVGLITIAQFGVGLLVGGGQFTVGTVAIGQFAVGLVFALCQFGSAHVVIAQFGLGTYVLAQFGIGKHVWDMLGRAPEAEHFFKSLFSFFMGK